jgi:hypothetical protein
MQKLKYSEKNEQYRLFLTEDELDLILGLLSVVRLDCNGNQYQQAAFNLLSEAEDQHLLDYDLVNVVCNVVDVDYTSLEVSPNNDR